jgi:hypothetical protein
MGPNLAVIKCTLHSRICIGYKSIIDTLACSKGIIKIPRERNSMKDYDLCAILI